MDKVYATFTNANDFSIFREHADFDPVYEYFPHDYAKVHMEELGRLKLRSFNLHLLLDSGRNKHCPWCDYPEPDVVFEKPISDCLDYRNRMYAQCPSCLARGPSASIYSAHLVNEGVVDEYKSLVLQRWASRKVRKIGEVE